MPLFGAHMSIAGGCYKALLAAQSHGMDTMQMFTASPRNWRIEAKADLTKNGKSARTGGLAEADIRQFSQTWHTMKLQSPIAHDSYLINLASADAFLYRRSLDAFVAEVERAEALGLSYVVMHPGTAVDGDETAGLTRVAQALDEVHERCPRFKVRVLLETTAGQGSTLGHRFEHLAEILAQVKKPDRLGVCVDTCHVFAAGYPLAPEKEYRATMKAFDRLIGLKNLKAFHLNDSKKPLGSRVDRHEHIGKGCLGLEPFRLLVNDSRFREHIMILETPKEGPNDEDMDFVNLATLKACSKPQGEVLRTLGVCPAG